MSVTNFALTGAAGYIAPRHFKAIKDTGNSLIAALDPFDSVGGIDSFFPDCAFFTEFERFDRHLDKLRRQSDAGRVGMISVCSPNYLHDAHIRFALRMGADALCEKPLVLNPWNLDALRELEQETGRRVWTILQLRVHPRLIEFKKQLKDGEHDVTLTYVTGRGNWYLHSWKGITEKSGGIATNIGIHFFDLLVWLFGDVKHVELHTSQDKTCAGYLELEHARVKWMLSIDASFVPQNRLDSGQRTYRSLTVDGEEVEFSDGFTDLHTRVYEETLSGHGFGLDEARKAVDIVHQLRTIPSIGIQKHSHYMIRDL
jgi:UDP-N-acetyl-2-amino-2-deoxyglucuronate dehydrogenase